MPSPVFTIVIACRNPGPRIHQCLGSLWDQTEASREIIVLDGASTDGTASWLEENRQRIDLLESGPDGGPYDAMNRGLARATGEWVLFLGADDRLSSPSVLSEAAARLRTSDADVAAGEAEYADGRRYPAAPTSHAVRRNFVHHQGTFYRRSRLARIAGFDTQFRIMADYDLNARLLRAGAIFRKLDLRVAVCSPGGMSDAGTWLGYREEIVVRHRHFPLLPCLLWDAGSVVRFLRKQIVR